MKRLTKFVTALALLTSAATGAWADTVDLSTLSAEYTATDGQVLTGSTTYNVYIAADATVTLSGVTINGEDPLTCKGDATVILAEGTTNTLTATIRTGLAPAYNKTLIIKGSGTLNAKGAIYSPGIGNTSFKDIIIQGGVINAQGASHAAGIGLGYQGDGGNITITGGIINAQGGSYAPGIGTGDGHTEYNNSSTCGNITISGGIVTATAGSSCPNSIGVGATLSTCGTITIGGVVKEGSITTSPYYYLTLDDSNDNGSTLTAYNGKQADVTLQRTLQTGGWNTFCAPFSIDTPTGWTVKELSSSSLTDGTLTLTFATASSIEAGKPYLVKVTSAVENPTYSGVTIANGTTTTETTYADFVPVMNPTSLTAGDKTVLFVSGGNKLTYPTASGNINAFRAYFQLKGDAAAVRAFTMNFDDDATGTEGIYDLQICDLRFASGIYTLDGRRVEGQPAEKGVYIVNGKKIVVK